MNRKQRRKMRRIAGKIRGWILTAMAIMAAYLVLCGVGITEMPEWGPDWYPVQVCMIVIGGGWLIMFILVPSGWIAAYYDGNVYVK